MPSAVTITAMQPRNQPHTHPVAHTIAEGPLMLIVDGSGKGHGTWLGSGELIILGRGTYKAVIVEWLKRHNHTLVRYYRSRDGSNDFHFTSKEVGKRSYKADEIRIVDELTRLPWGKPAANEVQQIVADSNSPANTANTAIPQTNTTAIEANWATEGS